MSSLNPIILIKSCSDLAGPKQYWHYKKIPAYSGGPIVLFLCKHSKLCLRWNSKKQIPRDIHFLSPLTPILLMNDALDLSISSGLAGLAGSTVFQVVIHL